MTIANAFVIVTIGTCGACLLAWYFGKLTGIEQEAERHASVMSEMLREARHRDAKLSALTAEVDRLHRLHVTGRRAGRS